MKRERGPGEPTSTLLPGSPPDSTSCVKSALEADECLDGMGEVVSWDLGCLRWWGAEFGHRMSWVGRVL